MKKYKPQITRGRLLAYACEGGVVHERSQQGFVTFGTIFFNRPHECRFAVVEPYMANTHGETYWAVDLLDLHQLPAGEYVNGAFYEFPDPDAATLAAIINHEIWN